MELELFFSEDNSISGKPEMRTRKLDKMMNDSPGTAKPCAM